MPKWLFLEETFGFFVARFHIKFAWSGFLSASKSFLGGCPFSRAKSYEALTLLVNLFGPVKKLV